MNINSCCINHIPKGISYNASCALFILYGINKEKITLEELNDADKMKELVKEIAFLEVY